jgi:UDPglucose 6-dehydrogenase
MRIAVIGAGYVGLTAAAGLASLGRTVICVDTDPELVDALERGFSPLREPELGELVRAQRAAGRLRAVGSIAELPAGIAVALLCLPTPSGADGSTDLTHIEAAAHELAEHLAGGVLVVKSTVPVGTGQRLARQLVGRGVRVVSNPEFLREGSTVHDFFHPERVVVGADDPGAAAVVTGLHDALGARVEVTDHATAELVKYASNAMLAVRASFANSLSDLAARLGADALRALELVGADSRIGPRFLSPGPGWGGSCLPKDCRALLRQAEDLGFGFPLLRGALRANDEQRDRVVGMVADAVGGPLQDVRIGVLGLAFKAGTGDTRDSPAVAVARALADGGASVAAHDPPLVNDEFPGLDVHEDPYQVIKGSRAVVLLTEWPSFRDLDWRRVAESMEGDVLIDTRHCLDPGPVRAAGLRLWTI